ncbi:MAG: sulfatase-like hydrolase/transferase [Alicyclobacillus herbarius]|uniref:sulfatase-like hydrolase/transferase n=1 Tax=Alicyclobacillus herbarius TaxID=122960 RepID=UPI0023529AD4|nr:sulfatase-like hydrolase/transferase [Alicyclobacillus herbarius]MCL6633804.1 sulfatase-like hydrolase/transferase [Alicyclobacillus herbarius]
MSVQPNLLLIVVDQQRYDCIGYAGRYPVQTPAIDQLAREGIWFSQAYSHIPLCSPARQSLVTGRRPEAFGSLWNYDNGLKVAALDPAEYAWPRTLAGLGYRTGYIGKWNVHPDHTPIEYGYGEYVAVGEYERYRAERYPGVVFTNGYFGETDPVPLEGSRTHFLARQACTRLAGYAAAGGPWHLRVDFPEPHLPCRPSAPYADRYRPEQVPCWHNFAETFANKPYIQRQQLYNWRIEDFTWADFAPVVARYYAVISQVDDAIGRILHTLASLGQAEDTIVVFTADHGDLCGAHRMMDKHYVMYDDVVHVPLIVRWPRRVAPGQVCSQFVYNFLDLPPTLADLFGFDTQGAAFHGRSFAPLLFGGCPSDWRSEVVATYNGQQFGLYTQRMIRNQRFKYVWSTTDVDEFYDLERDPGELVNVIEDPQHGAVLREFREKLYLELDRCGDGLINSSWLRDQLLHGRKLAPSGRLV